MDARHRGSISASPSFMRHHSMSGGAHGANGHAQANGGQQQQQQPQQSPSGARDYWTHHDIDYSWRFPYPENQQKEFYDPRSYIDEDRRRKSGRKADVPPEGWRLREKMRTQCAALVACLNIGVDPPDVVKPSPCARMECWLDPDSMLPAKALKAIGGRLQLQYERFNERAKFKTLLDPTAEELRKALISLRRAAGEERVLLHYNGHGVPKPTANGEIWVYNKTYTQYIPVSLYDLQTWMGGVSAPTVYVFDCSCAGVIVDAFQHFIKQRKDKLDAKMKHLNAQQQQQQKHHNSNSSSSSSGGGGSGRGSANGSASGDDGSETGGSGTSVQDEAALAAAALADPCRHILLAACGAHELLPLSPDLPADLFTACLTTPITAALRWFVSKSSLLSTHASQSMPHGGGVDGHFPSGGAGGASSPQSNRQRLYDLIDRLPGTRKPGNRKTPYGELNWIFTAITDSIAWNILPRTLFHKLFRQDLMVSSLFRNFLLAQRILASHHCNVISVPPIAPTNLHPLWSCWDLACDIALSQLERWDKHGTPFTPSTFFEEQLTSFEIWLEFGSAAKPPPMQLPVVLQVLLSTDHRLRALQLLARFIDKGLWAVNLALSVGIFPYVLKLLQSPSKELREVLVFIWSKILALDRAVQQDLSKIEYATYFIQHLLRYQAPAPSASAPHNQPSSAGARHSHSRNSSVSPSPYMHGMHTGPSMHSTPATTPFHGFTLTNSATSSAAATPLVHGMSGDATPLPSQFPHRTFPQHATPLGTVSDASQRHNPPPLDLPPSNNNLDDGTGAVSHSAQLRDHPPLQQHHQHQQATHVHMRAQPLHDPSVRLHDAAAVVVEEEKVHVPAFHSALPPVHPAPVQHRVPFPLDLSAPPASAQHVSNISPLHSPASLSAKPSPMLGGIAFSPASPLLYPSKPADRFDEKQASSSQLPDSMSDAHDLTRLAREILATTPLQHLLSVFILACVTHGNPKGQQTLLQSGLSFKDLTAAHLLHAPDPRLRRWTSLCIAKLWQGFGHAKSLAAQDQTPELLCQLLMDPVPDVRCAALYALGTFFGGKTAPPAGSTTSPTSAQRHMLMLRAQQRLDLEVQLGQIMCTLINDGSPVVRRELMIALAELIYFQQDLFLSIATAHPRNRESISPQGWHIWRAILRGCRDCSSQVQEAALAIKGYLKGRAILNQSQLGRMIGSQHNPGLQLHAQRERNYGYGGGGSLYEGIEGIEEEGGGAQDSRRNSVASRESSRSASISSSIHPGHRAGAGSTSSTNVASEQSIAHIDHDDTSVHGEDGAPLPTATHDSRPPQGQGQQPHQQQMHMQAPMQQQVNKNMPPIRHFNRYKMGHLRPGPGGPGLSGAGGSAAAGGAGAGLAGGAGGQRRSSDKSSIIRSMESSEAGGGAKTDAPSGSTAGAGTLDERAADQMWQVPKSRVFEDSYAQFAQPMLVPTSDQIVPTMSEIRHTKWRHARNSAMESHAWELRRTPPTKSSYIEVGLLNAEWEATGCVAFHPYESMLLASDNKSAIGVWNYSTDEERGKERLNAFSNDNPPGTKITQLELINERSVSLLLTASDDGVVRVWRGVHEEGRQQLVTAWVANPQPEVFYGGAGGSSPGGASHATTVPSSPSPHPHQYSHVDGSGMSVPGQSLMGEPPSAHTPAARLAGRQHSGVGMPPVAPSSSGLSVGMRHSVSTPALALSVGNASSTAIPSRSGSLVNVGSLVTSPANFSSQRSPSMPPSHGSPSQHAASGAINIPNFSLNNNNSSATPVTQRLSPSQSPPQLQLAASSQVWPAGTTASRRKQKPPLIVDWQQNRGRLLASGNGLETMRVWNVEHELCVADIPLLGLESLEPHLITHATSISSNGADMAWVGCADGAVRCYDLRLAPLQSLVSTARLHRSPVQSVRLQRHGHDGGMLVSASIGGDIALADVRMADHPVVRYHRSSHKDKTSVLSAFAVHDYSSICASGSPKPFIEIFDHAGQTIDTIKYHVGFLGQRIGPITTLAFHKHKLLLAAGSMDSHISVFAGEKSW